MFFSKLEQIFSTWKHFLCNEILFLINMCTSTSFMVITFKRKNSTYRRVYPSHWRYTVIPEFEKFDFIIMIIFLSISLKIWNTYYPYHSPMFLLFFQCLSSLWSDIFVSMSPKNVLFIDLQYASEFLSLLGW